MTIGAVNATGWAQLIDGNLIQAAYTMYTFEVGGWVVGILFLLFQFMLYLKTRNLTVCVVTTFMFCMLVFGAGEMNTYLPYWSQVIIVTTLIIEVAGIIYLWIFGD